MLLAADGRQALDTCRASTEPIAMVILDAGIAGLHLLEDLREVFPGMRALVISGFPQDLVLERTGLTARERFLMKPFTATRLKSTVREILSAPAGLIAGFAA
jgi:two-component system cell cycle sensor histidine kinase/response regulator CckA